MSDFNESVYSVVRRVPRGRLVSYGGVASVLGRPRAARGVGRALAALPEGSDVPWWRVVNRDGAVSLPGADSKDIAAAAARGSPGALQRGLLEAEGVRFDGAGRASWERQGWQPDEVELAELARLLEAEDAPRRRAKRAVSLLIRQRGARGRVLAVLRPPNDGELPDTWGLPASSLRAGESWRDAVRRTGREKLGVRLRVGRELGRGRVQRPGYALEMRLYAASVSAGLPSVPQADDSITQYREWEWARLDRFGPGAERGSLCCRLALQSG